jgi:UDP-N-acetylmuramoyl-tripeptide--D-alanyl-D-alanine ligase
MGVDVTLALEAMAEARPVGRRLRRARTLGGALLLDDCYNANLASMEAALQTAAAIARASGGRLWLALGDMLELGAASTAHHEALGDRAAECGAVTLVAFGREARATAEAAAGRVDRVLQTEDPIEAAAVLAEAGPRDVVLVKGSRGMAMERIVERLEAPGGVSGAKGGEGAP